ncbi:CrcB-like protein-domain-containing protein [Tribonema minus]|uniref:CrcB-like protein-domain-containing protein n=1 Tax=Tribonema minus TaxID=303371 RepID=A0A836C7N9_9STRA|nr:CrcB-like protein-domain-containing protein [Tribonema minus]
MPSSALFQSSPAIALPPCGAFSSFASWQSQPPVSRLHSHSTPLPTHRNQLDAMVSSSDQLLNANAGKGPAYAAPLASTEENLKQPPQPQPQEPSVVNLYVSVALWAIAGCYARIFTERLFGSTAADVIDADTLLVPSFFDNVAGSMILGFLVAASTTMSKGGGALVLLTGMSVGLCGAYTTFSAWTLQTNALLIAPTSDVPQPQIAALCYIFASIATFIVAHRVGADVGALLTGAVQKAAPGISEGIIAIVNGVLLVATAIGLSIALGVNDNSWLEKRYWLSGLFAIPGASLRYALARQFNKFRGGRFPLGTFLANIGGTLACALVTHEFTKASDWDDTAARAFVTGFCASLTTMSTLVNELAILRRDHSVQDGVIYLASTVILAQFIVGMVSFW